VNEAWATGETKEFQLCAANSSIASTVGSVENNHSAFAFYNDFQDYSVGDQLMTCASFQTHQISTGLNDKCLSTNMPTGGIGNYCENTTFFTDSRYATELIDTTRPFTYHEITYIPNTNNLRMEYMFSLRNTTTGSIIGAYPYGTQDITINGIDFEPNAISVNINIESWTLILPNQSALWKRFIPSNDYNYGTQHDISFQNMTITGYRISSKNEGGGSPTDALHDEIWLAYSLEKYDIEYNATGNIFGAGQPLSPANYTPNGTPVLNYPSGNYSTQLNLTVSGVTGAEGYVWSQNGTIVQNLSIVTHTTNFIFNNTYSIQVYGYNGSYMGEFSAIYIYNYIEQAMNVTNITGNVTNVTYQDRMQVNTCPNTISGVLNIWLFFFIGLILLIMGLVYSKIISLLGSFTIIISAFYMSACVPFVALVVGLGGVIAFSYSAIKQD
jgi:hypothetical protein